MKDVNKRHLQQLAEEVFSLQSFAYKTLEEAKKITEVNDYKICFDAFSLTHYIHNLSEDEYDFFNYILYCLCIERLSREEQKELSERHSLMKYLGCNCPYKEYEIEKAVRPDFILRGEKTVGIEVVKFTTKEDSILRDISNSASGKGLSIDEIKRNAFRKHKTNALPYRFYELNGRAAISTGHLNCNSRNEHYISLLQTKYDKYALVLCDYDDFIVLCDAIYTLEITSHEEAVRIIQAFQKRNPYINNVKIAILWENKGIKASVFDFY